MNTERRTPVHEGQVQETSQTKSKSSLSNSTKSEADDQDCVSHTQNNTRQDARRDNKNFPNIIRDSVLFMK